MQDLLLAEELPIDQDEEGFVEPTDGTLLGRLQRDIFTLTANGVAAGEAPAPDTSLEVHACHGPLRECQVLHDRLLGLFADRPGLRPEDVLVMVPDIAGYAPYIEAVFGYDPQQGRPFVPWNLSDLSVRDEHPLVAVFLELIELPHSRFGHAQILSYLDVPALAKRFDLDSEDIAQIREWLSSAQLRWGMDGAHKTRLGMPALDENTWSQAGLRLFAGYALGAGDALDGIVPIAGVDGGRSELLGRLWHFVSLLRDYAEKLSGRYRIAEWQRQLGGLLDDLFGGADDSEGQLQRIRDAVSELGEEAADIDETLSATFVRRWLERRLGAYSERARYLSGGVTFCGLQPMRSVPFEVICLLGMHERAFPRRDRPAEFDLMSEKPRPSDPRRADADRYLFLETLLCARQTLYISYVGRDVRSNAERQPSVLVRELLDYVDQRHGGAAARRSGPLSAQLTTTHSLQPFSPRNYGDDARSFDGYWCEVARLTSAAGGQSGAPRSHWPSRSLPPPADGPAPVTLLELERFLRHPIRHFVNARLEIYLGEAPVEDDDEPFTLDGLERLRLRQRLVADHLAGRPTPTARLRGEGMLPHGPFAELAHEQASLEVATLLERLEPYREQRPQQRPVDLDLDGGTLGPLRLSGVLDNLYAGERLLRWRAGRLGGGDLLGLWLAHLVCCASGDTTSPRSTLLATDGVFTLAEALPPEVARARLAGYVVRYHEGLCRPLPVLRQASFAYARALGQTKADPQQAGRSAWDGNAFAGIPGDKDDPYVALVTRGVPGTPVSHPDFALLAREFYEELLGCGTLA